MALDYNLQQTGPEVQERLDEVPITRADLNQEIADREAAVRQENERAVQAEQKIAANFANYYTKAEIDEMLHPTPQPTEKQSIYYGFADPETITDVSGLSVAEKETVAGTYSAINSTTGYQYFMFIPKDMTITRVTMDNFEFPMEIDGTILVNEKEYKKYMSTGSDLGYLTGEYDFIVE